MWDQLSVLDHRNRRWGGPPFLRQSEGSALCAALVIASARQLGADGYFRKPSNYVDFMKLGDAIVGPFAGGDAARRRINLRI